ncbi:MAG: MFS transporter, partial [Deltaproteobacteria bacterium]|nr:MFS transporter [Deltaproteobacteria bacterium]
MSTTIQYRWVILGVLLFCQLAQSISYQGPPPILGILIQHLNISYAQAGGLMSLYSFPRIFLALPSGMLVDRYGAKKVGCFALLTLSFGTGMFAAGSSYWFLAGGRLLAGIGTTFFLVATLHGVTTWFRDREVGLSMGSYHTAMPLGTILSLNFVGVFATRFGWRAPMVTIFILCAAAFLLFTVLYKERNSEMNVRPEPLNPMKILKKAGWRIWMVAAMWGILSGAILPYFTYAPDFFVSQGKSLGQAGLLASYPMWASVVLAPFFGIMIDRMGRKRLLNHAGFICCAVLYFLIPRFAPYAAVFAIIIGVFA